MNRKLTTFVKLEQQFNHYLEEVIQQRNESTKEWVRELKRLFNQNIHRAPQSENVKEAKRQGKKILSFSLQMNQIRHNRINAMNAQSSKIIKESGIVDANGNAELPKTPAIQEMLQNASQNTLNVEALLLNPNDVIRQVQSNETLEANEGNEKSKVNEGKEAIHSSTPVNFAVPLPIPYRYKSNEEAKTKTMQKNIPVTNTATTTTTTTSSSIVSQDLHSGALTTTQTMTVQNSGERLSVQITKKGPGRPRKELKSSSEVSRKEKASHLTKNLEANFEKMEKVGSVEDQQSQPERGQKSQQQTPQGIQTLSRPRKRINIPSFTLDTNHQAKNVKPISYLTSYGSNTLIS